MMFTLAVSDAANFAMWGVSLSLSTIIGIVLFYVAAGQQKIARLEDKRDERIARMEEGYASRELAMADHLRTAESKLHDTAIKLVDERIRAMSHEANNSVMSFVKMVEEMKDRLKEGEADFRLLGDRDQKLELMLKGNVDQLKDYIRDTAATKRDMEKHEQSVNQKFSHLEQSVGTLKENVAVLTDKVKRT